MHLKKLVCFGLMISLLTLNLGVTKAYASEIKEGGIESHDARFKYIDTATSRLSISNGVANVGSSVIGQSMVTKTDVTARLQQYVDGRWKTIQAWTVSSGSKNCLLSKKYSVRKGYSYRVDTTVTAYMNSSSERHDLTSSVVKY